MASFPTCESPSEVVIEKTTNSFSITWNGNATTYKMAYKKQGDPSWTIQTETGPGSSGGSGVNEDDTGGSVTPTAPVTSASFSASGLVPGIYEVRAINICDDGTTYVRSFKVAIEENVGNIPNLRLQADPGGNFQVNIEWDAPTIDSGNPIIINWCKVNRFGQKLDCSNDEVDHAVTQYSILSPGPDITMIWVAQLAANGFQYSVSDPLYIEGVPCQDNGCTYEPYILESDSGV